MRVKEAVVVITGASTGIGRATALAFAEKGAAVVLAARGEEALAAVSDECALRGAPAVVVPTDVSDADAVDELARRAVERFGRIDVWVNNAAVTLFGPFESTPLADIRRVLDVDIMGYVHGARAALPILREQGRGVLVNVASVVGTVSQPYSHAYIMAKFAIRGLSGSLRQELRLHGPPGVRVCTVLPATIDTPLFAHAANHTGRKVLAMPPVYAPERVARVIINLIRAPRREVAVGLVGRAMTIPVKLMPGLTERLVGRRVDRTHLSRTEPAPATSGNLYSPEPGTGAMYGGWRGGGHARTRRLVTAVLLATAAVTVVRWRRR